MKQIILRNRFVGWHHLFLFSVAGILGCNTMAGLGLPRGGAIANPGSGNTTGSNSSGTQPSSGNISPSSATETTLLEQVALERINRARLLPAAEAAMFGIAIDEGLLPGALNTTPKQPVTINANLHQAAQDHSADMLNRNYFAHDTPEGVTPFDRMRFAGFAFVAAAENLAWRGTTGTLDPIATVDNEHRDLFVDKGISGRGHRVTLLNGQLREVGISIIRGSFTRTSDGQVFSDSVMQTQDYATSPTVSTFLLGVVYNDTDQNGQYDNAEGVANSTVRLDNASQSTNQAGGYSFEITQPGTYTLRFASGSTQSLTITPGGPNIKVDLINRTQIVINLGVGPLN